MRPIQIMSNLFAEFMVGETIGPGRSSFSGQRIIYLRIFSRGRCARAQLAWRRLLRGILAWTPNVQSQLVGQLLVPGALRLYLALPVPQFRAIQQPKEHS